MTASSGVSAGTDENDDWACAPTTVGGQPATQAGHSRVDSSDLLGLTAIGGRSSGLNGSPDGRYVAVQLRRMNVAENRHHLEWVAIAIEDGARIGLGDGGDLRTAVDDEGTDNGNPATPFARWSPDSRWLAYLRSSGGKTEVWRAGPSDPIAQQLTHGDADVESFEWSADSSVLHVTRAVSRETLARTRRYDEEEGFLVDHAFAPAYDRRPRYPAKGDGTIWQVDSLTGKAVQLDPVSVEPPPVPAVALSPPKSRATRTVTAPDGRRTASLERLHEELQGDGAPVTIVASGPNPDSSQICPATECTGQITSLWWSQLGDRVYFLKREGHALNRRAIYEWRPGSRSARSIVATTDWIGDDCISARRRLVCLHESPTGPRRVVAIDVRSGRLTPLLEPNPNFRNFHFSQIERLAWHDRYRNETFGDLVYPAAYRTDRRFPLVIVQYRSAGFLNGGVGDEYPIHVLAARGYFVLSWDRPEFRTVAARESALDTFRYAHRENREHLSKQSALGCIVRTLVDRGMVDAAKVGITGLSDGAETTYHGLMHTRLYAVAIASSAPADPIAFYLQSARDRQLRAQLGLVVSNDSPQADEFWAYRSLSRNVARVDTPLLLNLAESEYLYAVQAIATFLDAGKVLEAYVYPGEFHIKHQPKHLARILERNVDWLDFWLRGLIDPDPAKADQYVRWTRMRDRKATDH